MIRARLRNARSRRVRAFSARVQAPACANDNIHAFPVGEEAPPFDPPDEDDEIFDAAPGAFENEELVLLTPHGVQSLQHDEQAIDIDTDEPAPVLALNEEPEVTPFDAPDEDDAIFGRHLGTVQPPVAIESAASSKEEALRADLLEYAGAAARSFPAPTDVPLVEPPRGADQPAPSIQIHASWDRPEIGHLFAALREDRRMARVQLSVERGGLDGAVVRCASASAPDLILIDTTLRRAELLAGLDRLCAHTNADTKIIIVGALNDVGLFRELAVRGVSEYILAPLKQDDLVRSICKLYAEAETARVIAVVGARGGVGASTIAHNLAWSIAERQEAGATLLDLDLCFGTAALDFGQDPAQGPGDALIATEVDDELLDRITARPTPRMQVLTAPASLERAFEIAPEAFEKVVERARRTNPFVVLDLPHTWNSWIRQTLLGADDVVIVATPDLASLRNAKNILELLKAARPDAPPPLVVLSMAGVPKRPEIMGKEFAEALGAKPVVTLAFEPGLYGVAEISGRMLGETAPASRAATDLDALATLLTGREPVRRKHRAGRPFESDAPLLLMQTAIAQPDSSYLDAARRAAQTGIEQSASPQIERPSILRRVMRVAAALAVLLLSGVWFMQSRVADARAAEIAPSAETAAPAAPRDAYQQALSLIDAARQQEAAVLLQRLAEEGDPRAQYRLAKLYERGQGVTTNLETARQWIARAAAAAYPPAMHDLGAFYVSGEGVARDEAAAFRWFRQAAELGVADSQYNLGVLYQEGRGVGANAEEALFWFTTAAAQGDAEADARAEALSAQLTPMQVEQARARALAFETR